MRQKSNSSKRRPFYRLIAILLVLVIVSAVHLPDTIAADTGTDINNLATLRVVVRTTEPRSDIPYIFRLSVINISNSDDTNILRFVVWINPNQYTIQTDTVTGEPVYTGEATIKLPVGNYRLEAPADSRWRYNDLQNAIGSEVPDDSKHAYVTPTSQYIGFSNNRVSFAIMDAEDEVTCTFNLNRVNERWLSASYVTPSYTE